MRRDDAYLLDILIAARKALAFVADMTWEAFEVSELQSLRGYRTQRRRLRAKPPVGHAAGLSGVPTPRCYGVLRKEPDPLTF